MAEEKPDYFLARSGNQARIRAVLEDSSQKVALGITWQTKPSVDDVKEFESWVQRRFGEARSITNAYSGNIRHGPERVQEREQTALEEWRQRKDPEN